AGVEGVEVGEVLLQLLLVRGRLGGGGFQRGDGLFGALQPLGGGRDAGQLGLKTPVGVEQGAVGLPVQQADGLVLAVHLDQGLADLAQGGDAGGLVVDEGAAAAVGGQGAAQDQLLAGGHPEAPLGDQADQGGIVGGGEDGGGRSLLRPGPDQTG